MQSNYNSKDLIIHSDTNEVEVGGKRIKLTPKEMGVLDMLNERSETTVTRTEILEQVWGEKFGNDQGLTQAISKLRGILSKSRNVTIITISKKGYQLQRKTYQQKASTLRWVKAHSKVLVIMFLGLIICFLLLTNQINIRVSKEPIDQDRSSQTSSS